MNIYEDFGNFDPGDYFACGAQYCAVFGPSDGSGLGSTDPVIALDSLSITPATTPVPEPATWAMMAIGVAGLSLAGFRVKNRAAATA